MEFAQAGAERTARHFWELRETGGTGSVYMDPAGLAIEKTPPYTQEFFSKQGRLLSEKKRGTTNLFSSPVTRDPPESLLTERLPDGANVFETGASIATSEVKKKAAFVEMGPRKFQYESREGQ